MKMKPTKTILMCVLASGLAAAQSPSVIENTRATMNAVRDNAAAASNAALATQEKPAANETQRVGMRVGTIVGDEPGLRQQGKRRETGARSLWLRSMRATQGPH